ncbi:MAG: ATP-binding cassette domain-containing protein [Alphaproteobacteria bacterium]|nr:ATP-binding cassette domain-containing protein [Alphaproteobacteria bacterium]
MAIPILSLRDAKISFGGAPLFENLSVTLCDRDKICLVGRNGSGKSTLLKALAEIQDLDKGSRFVQPGKTVKYLAQDAALPAHETILEFVTAGSTDPHGSDHYLAESILDKLSLDPNRLIQNLSGGERRRLALAEALAISPDVLLLDEPTNHLDLPTIEWLEEYLGKFRGAYVIISHDRSFLVNTSTSTLWLDRGKLNEHNQGFAQFDTWSEQVFEEEERHLQRLNTKLRQENEWLHRGVTARRKRNQGRLRLLHGLRAQKRDVQQNAIKTIVLQSMDGGWGSKLVVEAHQISKSFGAKKAVNSFSTRILQGERIGIIGPNGAGKTTLVKMLIGQLSPDQGSVTMGANIDFIYFDQMRESLDPTTTLWKTMCPHGGDQVSVQGQSRHVFGYLKDFLFTDNQINGRVGILSGGEKNRLALAKALAQPGNLLVLDEPTNDLDMDTLDLLVETLGDFKGTLLIVSHDRDFLDKLTTSIIAVEGDGLVNEYVGGYQDYIRQRNVKVEQLSFGKPAVVSGAKKPKTRLSYHQKRTLELAPQKIAVLEEDIKQIESKLSDPAFYLNFPDDFTALTATLGQKRHDLDQIETAWLELEGMS